ncbi:MAG TPA: MFS transporter [Casimicrobiaceae bacterium]|nr:MFS transporter [Casimicrobiaceae bacterium]
MALVSVTRRSDASTTLVAASLGFSVVQLDVTIVNTALDSIARALSGSVSTLQWVVTSYTITFASFILTAGALGDRVGAKRVFVAGFAIFTLASLGCALATTVPILIAARAIQGVGAAMLIPNSLALLNHSYHGERERAWAVGVWAAGASFSITAGPLVGGALIAAVGWRSIFLINLPIGLIGLWLTWRYVSETTATPSRELDLSGQATAILALGCLAAVLIEGGSIGWTRLPVIIGLLAFVTLVHLFVSAERKSEQPMLPLALFKRRRFTVTSIVGLLVNVAFYGLIFVFSLYFQRQNGYSPLQTGLAFAPLMVAVLVANLSAARISRSIGARNTIAIGAALAGVACVALLGIKQGTPYTSMVIPLIAMGAGLGAIVPPLTATLLGSVEKERSGVASGVLNSSRQTGSVLGVSLFGSLLAHRFIFGTRTAIALSAALFACACLAMLIVCRENRESPQR